ncbi:MAG: carboxylating nicotinate-nucleotide diphosphorylase [Phycisphaeraceae bacterium]|nr:carboxylating nicotinate-nucleotide diphosphorylase [Phycisphaerales bacterium]MCB9861526.1 carboxylating nicotinate-nucleotide diphosphorylase [Phycisphaeraceae bacterium]
MDELNALSLSELYEALNARGLVRKLMELAAEEDLGERNSGSGDPTTELTVPEKARCEATVVAREDGVVAGLAAVGDVLDVFAPAVLFRPLKQDGQHVTAGTSIGMLLGSMRQILAAERTLLNLLGRCMGVASTTSRYVAAAGTDVHILDTRKTTPGMRVLEKYSVRCGGGFCHRVGLFDAVMIKDNHVAGKSPSEFAETVIEFAEKVAPRRANEGGSVRFVEVEVDTLEQFDALLTLPTGLVDIVLLDNMTPDQISHAVARRNDAESPMKLEASGGITMRNIREYAETGVDRMSLGAVTHQATWLDVGLDVRVVHLAPPTTVQVDVENDSASASA